MMVQFSESTTRHRWVKLKPDFFYSFTYFICKVGQSGSVSFGAFDRVLFLLLQHETISDVLAIGSTAFMWKLCCHWIRAVRHRRLESECQTAMFSRMARNMCHWIHLSAKYPWTVSWNSKCRKFFCGFLRLSTILSDIAWSAKTVCGIIDSHCSLW